MPGVDIRPLKQRMRQEIKVWRRNLPQAEKAEADARILARLLTVREYQRCGLLLTYVSLSVEVDTLALIDRALADGKRVAVPRCVDGTREMEFYQISGREDLEPRTFGVLEPVLERCTPVEDFTESACVVPALAYDREGYRLGYGAGYYDRFLSFYAQPKIGLTYSENLRKKLWHGRYDVPVDIVVTEERLCVCAPKKSK